MTEKTTEKVALANATLPSPASPAKVAYVSNTALIELQWAQCAFTTELLKDAPSAARLDELGQLIRKAERRCLAGERDRPVLSVPLFRRLAP